MSLSVTFWGTRGSIPTPGAGTTRYGGNTPCVSIRGEAGAQVILDAGTGIRGLGLALRADAPPRLDLFLSHVHWDHIQGLPFFAPMYTDRQTICVYGPAPAGSGSLEAVLDRQMEASVYPVPRAARPAQVAIREIGAGATVVVPGLEVRSCALSHPGGSLGYRVTPTAGGPSVCYITDNELGAGGASRVSPTWRDGLAAFVRGTDLLIHDAMYTDELAATRSGWGHSSVLEAVALARDTQSRRLALFHHEPDHDDGQIDALLAVARASAPRTLAVDAAAEGWTVTL